MTLFVVGVTMNLSELSQVVKPGTLTDVIAVLPETDRLLTHKSICIPPANNFLCVYSSSFGKTLAFHSQFHLCNKLQMVFTTFTNATVTKFL